jgi:hypothetical protein
MTAAATGAIEIVDTRTVSGLRGTMVAPATFELTGRLLLGLETDTAQL